MWRAVLLLLAGAATPIDKYHDFDPAVIHLLHATFWADIGIGRRLEKLSPKEIAALKNCKRPSMGFEFTSQALVQTFYAGFALRTNYATATMRSTQSGSEIVLHTVANSGLAETLHFSRDGTVLVQQTPAFDPRTYIKCDFAKPAGRQRR